MWFGITFYFRSYKMLTEVSKESVINEVRSSLTTFVKKYNLLHIFMISLITALQSTVELNK